MPIGPNNNEKEKSGSAREKGQGVFKAFKVRLEKLASNMYISISIPAEP